MIAPTRTRVQRLAAGLLSLFGWRTALSWPPEPKAIIVVYPHTSNWDFVVGLLARISWGLPASFIGKHTLFRWPVGALMRRLGGIPVDRRAAHGLVAQLALEFKRRPQLWLALAPEGTRSLTPCWKSGFWHLAQVAEVPVGLAILDYGRKEVGLRSWVRMTGDRAKDLERVRAEYQGAVGRRPELASPIRFSDGDDG